MHVKPVDRMQKNGRLSAKGRSEGKERMAGNGRLKCLERKFVSITRRECDDVDLC